LAPGFDENVCCFYLKQLTQGAIMNRDLPSFQPSEPEHPPQTPDGESHLFIAQPETATAHSSFLRSKISGSLLSTVALMASISAGYAHAETAPTAFVPFQTFIESVRGSDSSEFLARPSAAMKVSEPASFEEMRQHVLKIYDGVQVTHSYVLGSQTFDCVPANQQPAIRTRNLKTIASEPPASVFANRLGSHRPAIEPKLLQVPAGKTTDEFDNPVGCEAHTIPMRRITLEQLSHFNSLHEFFQKGPNGTGHAPEPAKISAPETTSHKYAFAYQYVNNLGDSTNINVWRPYVYTDIGEIFSLAQSWTIGQSSGPVQTAEVGWQNYPALYGTENPVLFIYWTADGYNKTGCYNLDCGAFVQVNHSVAIGGSLDPSIYSVSDGHQGELQVQYYLWQGNWWLGVNGTWIGYYPGSLYKGGQLSKYANLIEFGSESVGSTVWPAEGSGLWANSGYTYAAYQRLLYYTDTTNVSQWDSLTTATPSPSCYSITQPAFNSDGGIYFYFGGPGGASCE
jgi:Neprosin